MIKQSFLRNYSLSKIYCQAEDEKKKLKVFYIRKVNKILKQKQQKERQAQRMRKSMDIRQTRLRQRQFQREKTKFKHSKQKQNLSKEEWIAKKLKKDEEQSQNLKQKADLRVTEVKFADNSDENTEIQRQTVRLKTTLNRSVHTKRTCKKNTLYQTMYPLKGVQGNFQVFPKSINHSRHQSDLSSCDEILKSKDTCFFQNSHQNLRSADQFQKNHPQKMIPLTPLKIKSNFKRKIKENKLQQSQPSSPLGLNLQFHKIM